VVKGMIEFCTQDQVCKRFGKMVKGLVKLFSKVKEFEVGQVEI
jgi:hypothetical protein